jgi:pyruvate dehydrogenase E2 component (dihydrolipoamide acetyltransferase)
MNAQDLTAAMSPEAVAQLNSLAADASKIDANPAATTVLAGLENPVNGAQLLTQMAQLNADAPAADNDDDDVAAPAAAASAPAPAAAPAPAPANSAAAQGVAVMATAGAALLAALLL